MRGKARGEKGAYCGGDPEEVDEELRFAAGAGSHDGGGCGERSSSEEGSSLLV